MKWYETGLFILKSPGCPCSFRLSHSFSFLSLSPLFPLSHSPPPSFSPSSINSSLPPFHLSSSLYLIIILSSFPLPLSFLLTFLPSLLTPSLCPSLSLSLSLSIPPSLYPSLSLSLPPLPPSLLPSLPTTPQSAIREDNFNRLSQLETEVQRRDSVFALSSEDPLRSASHILISGNNSFGGLIVFVCAVHTA